MFAKPEWFQRRKFGGWGISPKTWQGWIYIAIIIIPFAVIQSLPYFDTKTRTYITLGWLAFLLLDVTHIIVTMKRDEREKKIESLAERNAAWVMVLIIISGLLYEIITSAIGQTFKVNIFLVIALFGGMITKTISNFVLEKKSI